MQRTGLVDGNVSRVFSRLRGIGGEITSPPVTAALWSLANLTVDPSRPGDYNQALMELGATVCMPKTPQCEQCPLQEICTAYKQVERRKQISKSKVLGDGNGGGGGISEVPDIECCEL